MDAEDGAPQWARDPSPRAHSWAASCGGHASTSCRSSSNILVGDMSFVGPRPERPEFVAELEHTIPFYSWRHFVRPGLTGWAQINYPYGSSVEDARRKLEYDLFYIRHYSVLTDLSIVLRTVTGPRDAWRPLEPATLGRHPHPRHPRDHAALPGLPGGRGGRRGRPRRRRQSRRHHRGDRPAPSRGARALHPSALGFTAAANEGPRGGRRAAVSAEQRHRGGRGNPAAPGRGLRGEPPARRGGRLPCAIPTAPRSGAADPSPRPWLFALTCGLRWRLSDVCPAIAASVLSTPVSGARRLGDRRGHGHPARGLGGRRTHGRAAPLLRAGPRLLPEPSTRRVGGARGPGHAGVAPRGRDHREDGRAP